MADKKTEEIMAFGMTRQVIIDAVDEIEKEYTENEPDSNSYSEYIKNMKKGREALKKQAGYYPYLPRGAK
jgi:hypothetical protein